MKSEFAYVQYDEKACQEQNVLRIRCEAIRTAIIADTTGDDPHPLLAEFEIEISRSDKEEKYKKETILAIQQIKVAVDAKDKAEAIVRLEEAYFWAGKFVRFDQVVRTGVKE